MGTVTVASSDFDWAQHSLPWCFRQPLPDGRQLGSGRQEAGLVDYRVDLLDEEIELRGLRVLEPGSCDGNITVGLCSRGAKVTAFDARLPNVLKTLARVSLAGFTATVRQLRCEDIWHLETFWDVIFHAGVFYHLTNPVDQMRTLGIMTARALLLDTHTAIEGEPTEINEGHEGHWWQEGTDLWSGMQDRSFWLTEESLYAAARQAGFVKSKVLHRLDHDPCGPRAVYLFQK